MRLRACYTCFVFNCENWVWNYEHQFFVSISVGSSQRFKSVGDELKALEQKVFANIFFLGQDKIIVSEKQCDSHTVLQDILPCMVNVFHPEPSTPSYSTERTMCRYPNLSMVPSKLAQKTYLWSLGKNPVNPFSTPQKISPSWGEIFVRWLGGKKSPVASAGPTSPSRSKLSLMVHGLLSRFLDL